MAATGILLRRNRDKSFFVGDNALIEGELVVETTTNSFGYIDQGDNLVWGSIENELPIEGDAGQILAKATATDFDVEWITLPEASSGNGFENTSIRAVAIGEGYPTAILKTFPYTGEVTIAYSISSFRVGTAPSNNFENAYTFTGSFLIPGDLPPGNIWSIPQRLNGFNENGLVMDWNDSSAQKVYARNNGGNIEFTIENANVINEFLHSANITVIPSTTGLSKDDYQPPG